MSKWQSVTDTQHLPPYDKLVLLWDECHKEMSIGYRMYTDTDGEHWDCDQEDYITHWTELPEPPNQNLSLLAQVLPSQKSKGEKS